MKPSSLANYDDILSQGYPSSDNLKNFPLGEKLLDLDCLAWTTTARVIKLKNSEPDLDRNVLETKLKEDGRMLAEEKIGDIYRQHIRKAFEGLEFILTDNITKTLLNVTLLPASVSEFSDRLLTKLKLEEKMFLRFVLLYHDIGKVIHRERHPGLGRHLLESLIDDDSDKFKAILKEDESGLFFLMTQLVGEHDLLGVLNTGEASRLVLIDALWQKNSVNTINYLTIVTLADIYGTLNMLSVGILKTVTGDWSYMTKLIIEQRTSTDELYRSYSENKLLIEARDPISATDRIKRLATTTIYKTTNISDAEKRTLASKITDNLVHEAIRNRLGPEHLSFCYHFALVCKFDYTLRFFQKLVNKWIDKQKTKKIIKSVNDMDVRSLVAMFVDIFARLVDNYRDLTHQREGWPRRIGIELLGLTRSDQITDRVIELLLGDRHTEGVNWIADEATAWYFT